MARKEIQVNVNLDALRGELQRALQEISMLVSFSLAAPSPNEGIELRLPTTSLTTTFDARVKWSSVEVKARHDSWAITNGFRDCVEAVSSFLESAHQVLSVWELGTKQQSGTQLRGEDWHKEVTGGQQQFQSLGLPDKLKHLRDKHGIASTPELEVQVLSINQTRNCLVHRRGAVTERDLNADASLNVSWTRLRVLLKSEDGESDLVIGQSVEKGGMLSVQTANHHKSFPLGTRVHFTAQEFADLQWGLFTFGADLVKKIGARGMQLGFITSAPA